MYGCLSRSFLNSGKTFYKSSTCRCKISNELLSTNRSISYSKKNYLNKKLTESENVDSKQDEHNLSSSFAGKYKVFRDEEASVIFDVNEEQKRIQLGELDITENQIVDPYDGINMNRRLPIIFNYITSTSKIFYLKFIIFHTILFIFLCRWCQWSL